MIKTNKKSIYFSIIIFLLLALCWSLATQIRDKRNINNYTSENTNETDPHRAHPDCFFSDFDNLDRKVCGQRLESEIKSEWPELIKENFKNYPDLAGYYLPKNFIDDIGLLDVDKDGKGEKIVYYTCPGCNAPSRNIDIIKDDRIIFSAHGGNLSLEANNENFPGFILSDSGLVLLRAEGYTKIKFKLNDDGEYFPYEEDDIKY